MCKSISHTCHSLTCLMWNGVKHTVKMTSTVVSSWTALLLLSLRKHSFKDCCYQSFPGLSLCVYSVFFIFFCKCDSVYTCFVA